MSSSTTTKKNEKKRPRPSFIISDDEEEDPAMAQSSQGFFYFEMDDGHDEELANALPPSPIATPPAEDDDAAILSTPPKKARRKLSYGKPSPREIEQARRLKAAHAQKRGGVLTQELEKKIASEKSTGKKGAGSGGHLSLLALEVVREHSKEEEEDSKNGGEKEKSAQKKEREEEEKVRPNPKKTGSLTDKPDVVQATDAIRCGDKMIVYGAIKHWGSIETKCLILERPYINKMGQEVKFNFNINLADVEETATAMRVVFKEMK